MQPPPRRTSNYQFLRRRGLEARPAEARQPTGTTTRRGQRHRKKTKRGRRYDRRRPGSFRFFLLSPTGCCPRWWPARTKSRRYLFPSFVNLPRFALLLSTFGILPRRILCEQATAALCRLRLVRLLAGKTITRRNNIASDGDEVGKEVPTRLFY